MSRLCPGKEAEVASDDFIAVSDVTETAVCETWLRSGVVPLASHGVEMQGVEQLMSAPARLTRISEPGEARL